MTTTTSRWISVALAGTGLVIGILAGGGSPHAGHTHNLADYGAAVTAEDASDAARSRGVPHMDDHRHSAGYFEEMNGGDR